MATSLPLALPLALELPLPPAPPLHLRPTGCRTDRFRPSGRARPPTRSSSRRGCSCSRTRRSNAVSPTRGCGGRDAGQIISCHYEIANISPNHDAFVTIALHNFAGLASSIILYLHHFSSKFKITISTPDYLLYTSHFLRVHSSASTATRHRRRVGAGREHRTKRQRDSATDCATRRVACAVCGCDRTLSPGMLHCCSEIWSIMKSNQQLKTVDNHSFPPNTNKKLIREHQQFLIEEFEK
jgi:hypothetical protein